ncbi:MAG TPA: S41 family peptidase [Thermoleophilaceae bacterium]|nr:S41 family peptidase [Thermoleophilaceae bacterium]
MLAVLGGLAIFFLGLWLGGHPSSLPEKLRDTFVAKDISVRDEVINTIEDKYYKKVPRSQLDNASLKGIVESLGDRFSNYFSPSETKTFDAALNGQYEGIGITVNPTDRGLEVVGVFVNSPAAKAGIRKGDVIVAVNGQSIKGAASRGASDKIQGKPGTSVQLSVSSPGETRPRVLTVKRAKIQQPVADGRVVTDKGDKIGVVSLATFSEGAHAKLKEQVDKVLKQGAKGLVLDLRGNGGGLLQEGRAVASIFVPKGLIVRTDGPHSPEQKLNATGGAISPSIPMTVLVDGGTASAAEIVTGALRDYNRATVVGSKTFGKGVFQEIEPLSNGGALELVVGRYFLPHGENISGTGIEPQVSAKDDQKTPRDEALDSALNTVRAKIG